MAGPEKIVIVAMTRKGVIGRGGALPWHIREELGLFRDLTWGETLVMGRKTFESIGGALPGRINIVVSRTLEAAEGAEICRSFEEALDRADGFGRKIFFAGGESIYRRALPLADRLHVSWIREDFPGDTYFPPFDEDAWNLEREEEHEAFTHRVYGRPPGPAARE